MSPRSPEANELLHAERRATILEAALDAFVEAGFEGTRIQDVADRCGLSYGLVYRYFPDKEAVFGALVDRALSAAESLIRTLPVGASAADLGAFAGMAVSGQAPRYFAIIAEALTKRSVPPALAAAARAAFVGLKTGIATAAGGSSDGGDLAEGLLALLIGASVLRLSGLSDGRFAPAAATTLAGGA